MKFSIHLAEPIRARLLSSYKTPDEKIECVVEPDYHIIVMSTLIKKRKIDTKQEPATAWIILGNVEVEYTDNRKCKVVLYYTGQK
ncbi:MAG: hypothetical protein QM703_19230, partial [Gemmatales bacterium]